MGSKIGYIWTFYRAPRGSEPEFDKNKRRLHYCLKCSNHPHATSYSNNARTHLWRKHCINVDLVPMEQSAIPSIEGSTPRSRSSSQMTIFESLQNSASTPSREEMLRIIWDHDRYINAVISLVTRRRLPFSIVEWQEFKELSLAGNPMIDDRLLTSRKGLKPHIASAYLQRHDILKGSLSKARSMVHFSADTWTSPNRRSFIAICAHWVDENYRLRKALLGLPECKVEHTGSNLASLIFSYIKDFELTQSLGYFTGDNARNNDTCLTSIETLLATQFKVGRPIYEP
jgi:hypothetical protein